MRIAYYRQMLNSHREIMSLWPSLNDLVSDLNEYGPHDVHKGHVSSFKNRDSLPPAFWPALVRAARQRRIRGVTLQRLADIKEAEYAKVRSWPKVKKDVTAKRA